VIEPNPPIFFVRHGETDWNRERRIQGQIDIPLNDLGHQQSAAIARGLRELAGAAPLARFIVSPLTRARQTMGYVAREFGIAEAQVQAEAAVTELAFGIWEGKTFAELKTHPSYPKSPEARFVWRPPEGESYADGHERLKQWIGRLDGPTVIVAHGAIGRCLIGLVSGLAPAELVAVRTPQGSFSRLENGRIDWFDADGNAA
jgi:probable phosphoglycerate mutase